MWNISGAAGYEGPSISLLKLQKSTWHTEAEPPVSTIVFLFIILLKNIYIFFNLFIYLFLFILFKFLYLFIYFFILFYYFFIYLYIYFISFYFIIFYYYYYCVFFVFFCLMSVLREVTDFY